MSHQVEAACLDCGKPYDSFPLDTILPRNQWLAIHPAEGGLLCANCIVERAAKLPGVIVAHMVIEIAPRLHDPSNTCLRCANLMPFELADDLFTCPVVNIRIHRNSAKTFGCLLWEASGAAHPATD